MEKSERPFQKTSNSTNFGHTLIESVSVDFNLPPQTSPSVRTLNYEVIAKLS